MRNRPEPTPVGARAEDKRCMKTAPSRKTAGEEGDRAKAAAAIAGAWAGRTLKCPVRPRHGLVEPLMARGGNAATPPAPSRCRPSIRTDGFALYRFRGLAATGFGTMGRQTGQRDASRDTNGTATGCPMRRRAERLRSSRTSDAKRAAPGCPVRGPSRGECASLHWLVRLEPLLHSCSRIVPYGLQFSHVQSSDDPPV